MRPSVVARWRLAVGGALVLFTTLCTRGVAAQPNQAIYEAEHTRRLLESMQLSEDPQPDGKRIAFVHIVRGEVLAGDELLVPVVLPRKFPTWPNAFHWRTQESVVRNELLLREGGAYDTAKAEESMRNLRALGTFSFVRIVAVRTGDPNTVGVVVNTRDLWSLRFETPFSGTGGAFSVGAQLIERNFLGLNKQLAGRFFLDPKSMSFGEEYTDPRIAGGPLQLDETFDVIVSRDRGSVEGTTGQLLFGSPFRTLDQKWAVTLSGNYAVFAKRLLQGSEVAGYRVSDGRVESCTPPSPDCLRAVWEQRQFTAGLAGSYRTGVRYKQTFTFGAAASGIDARAIDETGPLTDAQRDAFANLIAPTARRQIYPRFAYELWLPTYVVYENLSTFGQSESVRVGPSLNSIVTFPLSAFGSTSDSFTFSHGFGYVLGDGKALGEVALTASARLEDGHAHDQLGTLVMRGATPPWLLGRLVGYASWSGRRHDTSHTAVVLGGDSGLRGFENGAFRELGASRLRGNLEYRSLPVVFQTVHFGGVLFYDVGSVYTRFARAEFHHSIGAGLRVLLPQFNHTPFRADVGLPLDRKGFAVLLSYGSEQAVPLTAADDLAQTVLAPR